ncbi:taurine catabolism dioxygenase TauD [Sphingobium sp. LB126]|uniref:TauD/TfdA dioxygenase family protein n=1 Tax=Sphingobium sp. LB126 TaxID=1983755 RepID=UPI000C201C3C|nr:TauD/TfdA family dioxygenase [Sphingobium sp. LB126]PJG46090.1 taurine catabolism dioxygenase TauD [Sphingobium sp. LB126]
MLNQAPIIERRPLDAPFGLEIVGADLTRDIDDATRKSIHDAWIDAGILLFRDLRNDDLAQMRLSTIFGEMEPAATADLNDPVNQFMMTLAYDPQDPSGRPNPFYRVDGIDRAGWLGWHWDQSFMPTIVRGAVLRMTEPARAMGETGFIDAIQAYDRLSPDMKARIEGLEVVYEFNPDFCSGQFGFPKDIERLDFGATVKPGSHYNFPPVVHPLVITQRETGRKVLKLSPMHARYVLDMDKAESDALLTELATHLGDPAHAYFHQWRENDMVVWDNWRIVHSANGVPLDCKRTARRTTIAGDYKVGRYLDRALDRDRQVKRLVD